MLVFTQAVAPIIEPKCTCTNYKQLNLGTISLVYIAQQVKSNGIQ